MSEMGAIALAAKYIPVKNTMNRDDKYPPISQFLSSTKDFRPLLSTDETATRYSTFPVEGIAMFWESIGDFAAKFPFSSRNGMMTFCVSPDVFANLPFFKAC